MENPFAFEIGVISDTHGVVDALALKALEGVNHIFHAGDFESYQSLRALKKLAPVTLVLGNVDFDRRNCHASAIVTLASLKFYIIHDLSRFDIPLFDSGLATVIHGHTHEPSVVWKNGVLFFNPGSARHPRSQTPRSVGRLRVEHGQIQATHHYF